jgi:hypothetical protein
VDERRPVRVLTRPQSRTLLTFQQAGQAARLIAHHVDEEQVPRIAMGTGHGGAEQAEEAHR